MKKRVFVVAPDLCSGCKSCEMFCSLLIGGGDEFDPSRSRVRVVRDEGGALNLPLVNCDGGYCLQNGRAEPVCVEMCPTGTLAYVGLEEAYQKRMELSEKRKLQPLFKLIVPWKYPYPWKPYQEES